MLYHLHYLLVEYFSGFNVFRYITFRSAYALVTALLISFLVGPHFIRFLRRMQLGEEIREEGPASHQAKRGTPTMGGLLIITSILIPTLLWADLTNRYIQLVMIVTVWTGLIGFMDDYLKTVKKHSKGLVGRYKLAGQLSLGLALGLFIYFSPLAPEVGLGTEVPFLKGVVLPLGWLYIPLVVLVVTGTSNAVNLTDGLDGLAIGITSIVFVAFTGLAYVSGHSVFCEYLGITYLPGAGELTIYCSAVVGASLGFLWFNSHPAEIFMGDTGSLALGGALGTIAILLKKELLLIILGGVFVIESLSVILQVGSFKLRGRRIFKMAPLHHHFELLGWPESKIVTRFWILAILLAMVGLSTLKLR
ncbi:MAG: phospho-N-acetylmuramoyl-pentapeptide-transferase [bacterium]|nr:phospho-N-acetylmuramoyl-pentapeptide-transferase [bacterium]